MNKNKAYIDLKELLNKKIFSIFALDKKYLKSNVNCSDSLLAMRYIYQQRYGIKPKQESEYDKMVRRIRHESNHQGR